MASFRTATDPLSPSGEPSDALQIRTPSPTSSACTPTEASRDFKAVSLSSPIIVECGRATWGREPRPFWFRLSAPYLTSKGIEDDESGSKVGIVDVAWAVTRPLTYAISLSSNCHRTQSATSCLRVSVEKNTHSRDLQRGKEVVAYIDWKAVRLLSDLNSFTNRWCIDVLRHWANFTATFNKSIGCHWRSVYNDLRIKLTKNKGADRSRLTILRGLTWGTMVLTARPSFKPSISTKSNRQANWTSTSLVTYFDGGSSIAFLKN